MEPKTNHYDLKDLFLEDQGGPALASTWGSASRCTMLRQGLVRSGSYYTFEVFVVPYSSGSERPTPAYLRVSDARFKDQR